MITHQKKRKINPMLLNVLLISVGVHVVALFILGSITVYKYIIPDEAQFEEPSPVAEEQPPPEVKIEIKQQPPKQQAMQSLRMKQVGNIAVSAVDVNLPNMQESFTVSAGMGGFGSGSLLGGTRGTLGIGMSDISVFGLKTRAERILFVIDANSQMLTDAKGGLKSYKIIKDEITDMVGNLSAGTLFNVMMADRRNSKFFKKQLVPAGQEVHQQLIQWITPINANARNAGLVEGASVRRERLDTLSKDATHEDILWANQPGNDTAFMTQLAVEQDVDAIFFIAGYHRGFERVRRRLTEQEEADWIRFSTSRKYQDQLAMHQKEVPIMQNRINYKMKKINEERKAKGQPARVLNSRWGIYSDYRELGLEWETEHPGWRPDYFLESREIEKYFKKVVDILYTNKGSEKPSVNVILFLAGDEEMRKEWEDQLDDYTDFFRGKYRIIRGLAEISNASSSSETQN
ncbi:MAG: hypothetical protein ACJ0BK_06985 [Coraliomargaritaceae bacterium]